MNILRGVGSALLIMTITACSGSTGTGNGSLTGDESLNSLQKIPKATQPVSGIATSSSLTRSFGLAETGLPLAPAEESEFSDETYSDFIGSDDVGTKVKSYGACEALNKTRGALAQAASADMVMCFLGSALSDEQAETFADGEYHIITIGEDDFTYKIKFKATKNSAGLVTSFEMFSCEDGTQTEYTTQTIDDGELAMTSKGVAEPENPDVDEVVYQVGVSGTVDEENKFTGTKTITMRYQNAFSNDRFNHSEATITQTESSILYNGYSCEKETEEGECGEASSSFLYSSELLNNNTSDYLFDLNLLAVGHGAFTQSSGGDVTGWDGDSAGEEDNGEASEASREAVEDEQEDIREVSADFPAVSFSEAQQWDCEGEAEADLTLGEDSACGGLSIDQNVHLECSDLNN